MEDKMFDVSKIENDPKTNKEVNDAVKAVDKMQNDVDKNMQSSTLKEDVANTVGNMLPQGAGYDTSVLNKSSVLSEDSDIDDDGKELLDTCDDLFGDIKIESEIFNFIVSESTDYDVYVEASILGLFKDTFKKPGVSELEQLYIKSQVLLCKKQYMGTKFSKEMKDKELRKLDKDCINAERDFRKAFRKAKKETQEEFNNEKKKLDKIIRLEFKSVKEKMDTPMDKKVKFSGTEKLNKTKSVVKESSEMDFLESYDWKSAWDKEIDEIQIYTESRFVDMLFGKNTSEDLEHFVHPDKYKAISILKKVNKLMNKSRSVNRDGTVEINKRVDKKLNKKIDPSTIKDKELRGMYQKDRVLLIKTFDYETLISEVLKISAQTKKLVQTQKSLIGGKFIDKDYIDKFSDTAKKITSKKNTATIDIGVAIEYLEKDYDRYEKMLMREMNDLIKLAKKTKFASSSEHQDGTELSDGRMKDTRPTNKLFDNNLQKMISKTYLCLSGVMEHLRTLNKKIVNMALDIKEGKATFESADFEYMEAANIGEKMRPIIALLNSKGYRTKYSSPGYHKERRKEDRNKDGVYNGKLYTTGRIMFEEPYKFPPAPKYWKFRQVDGKDYLDVEEKWFNPEGEKNPDEAWSEWQQKYLDSMMTWVKNLDYKTDSDNGKNDKNDMDNDESISVRHHTNKDSRADIAEDKKIKKTAEPVKDDKKDSDEESKSKDDDKKEQEVEESIFNEIDSIMDDLFLENDIF